LVENLLLREDICDTMEKIVSYFIKDDPLTKERHPSLSSFSLLQISKNHTWHL
jgi:hypothetical protein